jgi:Integrase core domain
MGPVGAETEAWHASFNGRPPGPSWNPPGPPGRDDRQPNAAWVTQQARNLLFVLEEQGRRVRFLLRDRDAKFCYSFDDVFRSEGADIVLTPVQAPNANAYAERWIRTVRAECLDWLLIIGQGHLDQILRVYGEHYDQHRPHRALLLEPPNPARPRIIAEITQPRCTGGPARRSAPRVPTNCMNTISHPTPRREPKDPGTRSRRGTGGATLPTPFWAPTNTPAASTTAARPATWCTSWRRWATRSPSSPPPDQHTRCSPEPITGQGLAATPLAGGPFPVR